MNTLVVGDNTNSGKNINLMKSKLNKKSLIWCKVYIDRARMYIGYANFLMLGLVFLNTFKHQKGVFN